MLKNIPKIISPDLIKVLMEMGHGDEIVLADANYPSRSNTDNLVRYDGIGIPDLLDAILKLFPIDTYVPQPISLMALSEGETYEPTIWEAYEEVIKKHESIDGRIEYLSREDFYERGKEAYCIVATGEEALYANIILKKGVVS